MSEAEVGQAADQAQDTASHEGQGLLSTSSPRINHAPLCSLAIAIALNCRPTCAQSSRHTRHPPPRLLASGFFFGARADRLSTSKKLECAGCKKARWGQTDLEKTKSVGTRCALETRRNSKRDAEQSYKGAWGWGKRAALGWKFGLWGLGQTAQRGTDPLAAGQRPKLVWAKRTPHPLDWAAVGRSCSSAAR
ncbi:hypothetical protein VTI74DRAFT_5973 [Chaetomium olivicolor]